MQRQLIHNRYQPILELMLKLRSIIGESDAMYELKDTIDQDDGYYTTEDKTDEDEPLKRGIDC